MSIQALQCSNCSAPLDPSRAEGGVIRCPYCHTVFRLSAPAPATGLPASGRVRAVLQSFPGNKKIKAIAAIRQATGVGLKEAKDLVESAPVVVGDLSPRSAERLKSDMDEIGGVVTFSPI